MNNGATLQAAEICLGIQIPELQKRYSHLINSTLKEATDVFGDKVGKMWVIRAVCATKFKAKKYSPSKHLYFKGEDDEPNKNILIWSKTNS